MMAEAGDGEWMEEPDVPLHEMIRVLEDLRRVNLFFGGVGPTLALLLPMIRRSSASEFSVLDVAAGDGFLLRRINHAAAKAGRAVKGTALDLHPTVTRAARQADRDGELRVVVGDALHLPFRDKSFDFAVCNLALHHLGLERSAAALREMQRVARRGFVVNDLHRSLPGYYLTRLALPLLRCHPITRHDGPLSMQRAFTREEYARLISRCGIPGIRYRERPWFRSLLWWEQGM